MNKKSTSKSAPARRSLARRLVSEGGFFNLRVLIASLFCLAGIFTLLLAAGIYSDSAKAQGTTPAQPGSGLPTLVRMVGPVGQDQDLRSLPYIPPSPEIEERRLTRHPRLETGAPPPISGFARFQSLLEAVLAPVPAMPGPVLTFDGMNAAQSGCNCLPSDSDGDVGPNNYVNVVNTSIKIFDKSGNPLNGANGTTFNSFFHALGAGNPCGNNQNGGNPPTHGDPFVFYDQIANRWVVTDIAFPSFPGTGPFYECIGVSKTGDPVSGGWWLYALQVDPAFPNRMGDYPKFALWRDAYYLTMNEFTDENTFNGVRVYALDRSSMINGTFAGGPHDAVGFTIDAATLGDAYSLVPASFRTGSAPPAGRDEFLLAIDSPSNGGVPLTKVKGWKFHVDFGTPANSTLGVGGNHAPDAQITVNGFVDAFTTTTTLLVPQQGTSQRLDTVGDKIMAPVVYQNRSGTESLWASHTVCTDTNCTGPTAVRWYQFNVTGGNFPATPVQQQSWTNGNDGLWRWMPSIAVDQNGNTAIGYSTSSLSIFPSIRYAGRLAIDALNNLAQGEAIMTNGGGAQLISSPPGSAGRWGDYSMTTVDPVDGTTFWHVNEYYPATSNASWATRIGKFNFPPTPTLGNISTRGFVQTGDNVMIGGFIVQGTGLKTVIVRAIGPELTRFGVPNALANPTLELHDGTRALIASNDNWQTTVIGGIITSSQVAAIQNSGHAPGDPIESAIIATLPPGNYTAILRGVNNTTGVALVEVYDLAPTTASVILGNISTRDFVQTGDNVMIGGFIVQGTGLKTVIVRAIGPELTRFGVPNALANPTLELHDGTRALIASNDNWQTTVIGGIITSSQVAAIQNSGHAPGDPSESAIIATLPPGNYTAIVRGVNNTTGVALVEVDDLD